MRDYSEEGYETGIEFVGNIINFLEIQPGVLISRLLLSSISER